MPDGVQPGPGGWNRIHLIVVDLVAEVERLRRDGRRLPQRHRPRTRRQADPGRGPIRQRRRTLPTRWLSVEPEAIEHERRHRARQPSLAPTRHLRRGGHRPRFDDRRRRVRGHRPRRSSCGRRAAHRAGRSPRSSPTATRPPRPSSPRSTPSRAAPTSTAGAGSDICGASWRAGASSSARPPVARRWRSPSAPTPTRASPGRSRSGPWSG